MGGFHRENRDTFRCVSTGQCIFFINYTSQFTPVIALVACGHVSLVLRYFHCNSMQWQNVLCFIKMFWKWMRRCEKVPLIKTVKLFI